MGTQWPSLTESPEWGGPTHTLGRGGPKAGASAWEHSGLQVRLHGAAASPGMPGCHSIHSLTQSAFKLAGPHANLTSFVATCLFLHALPSTHHTRTHRVRGRAQVRFADALQQLAVSGPIKEGQRHIVQSPDTIPDMQKSPNMSRHPEHIVSILPTMAGMCWNILGGADIPQDHAVRQQLRWQRQRCPDRTVTQLRRGQHPVWMRACTGHAG